MRLIYLNNNIFKSKDISEIERATYVLMSLLFLLQVFLELEDAPLQVAVDVDVPRDYALHVFNVLIDVVLHLADTLYV